MLFEHLDNLIDTFLHAPVHGFAHHLGILRALVGLVDASEALDHSRSSFGVQPCKKNSEYVQAFELIIQVALKMYWKIFKLLNPIKCQKISIIGTFLTAS